MFAINRQGFTSWRGKDFLYTMFSHQCSCRVSLHREISHAGPPHQQFAALHQSLIQFLCPAVHAILSSLVQFSILFFLYLFLGTPQPVLEMPINWKQRSKNETEKEIVAWTADNWPTFFISSHYRVLYIWRKNYLSVQ